ncbi:MAG: anti-sigma factor [Armatimonadota bacterium]
MSELRYECQSVRELLPEYAEGALIGRELARVEQHLSSCERCRQEVADLRMVIGELRAIPADEVPDTLVPRLRRAIQERAPAPGLRLLWPRVAVPVAVLAAVIALGFALRLPQQRRESARQVALAPSAPAAPETAGKPIGAESPAGLAGARGLGITAKLGEAQRPAVAGGEMAGPTGQAATGTSLGRQAPDQLAFSQPAETEQAASAAERQLAQSAEADRDAVAGAQKGALADRAAEEGLAAPAGAPAQGVGGGGARGATRERRAAPPGRFGYPGPYRPQPHKDEHGARQEEPSPALSAGADKPKAEGAPSLARATLMQGSEGKMIALSVVSKRPTDTITVRLGAAAPKRFQWRDAGAGNAVVPLSLASLGPGPAAIPVEVTSSAGSESYMIFVPTMARLGEVAPTAPKANYAGEPLSSVLLDLSKTTGLVILAQQPLDRQISGPLPPGTPEASLRKLGDATGFDVQVQDGLVCTLTRRP